MAKMIYYVTDIDFLSQIHAFDQFETEIVQLRQPFTGPGLLEMLFIPAYCKCILTDGGAHYTEGI
jgi:hypothetical protein